jgi:hypothetical protein
VISALKDTSKHFGDQNTSCKADPESIEHDRLRTAYTLAKMVLLVRPGFAHVKLCAD